MLVGCIDVASNIVETPDDVARTIGAALPYVPADRLYPCTNCGMAPMATEIAYAKLAALAAGAEIARKGDVRPPEYLRPPGESEKKRQSLMIIR